MSKSKKLHCMREAGKIVAESLSIFSEAAVPGNTTGHLNDIAKEIVSKHSYTKSSFYGYKGYPAYVCTSVEDVVVHGIPSYGFVLHDGQIISIDFAVSYKGWHADACVTVPVGEIDNRRQKLINAVRGSLNTAILSAKPGRTTGNISYAIQSYLEGGGYKPVTFFTGHGIGRNLHEKPQVLNYGYSDSGVVVKEASTLAIEPIGCEGVYTLERDEDGWTFRTKERNLTAHFEHTIVVTSNGPEILTKM